MDRQTSKDVLYGGIVELVNNPKFYYHSSVGAEYSYWTKDGLAAVEDYLSLMAYNIHKSEAESLDNRAKAMILSKLKGEEG